MASDRSQGQRPALGAVTEVTVIGQLGSETIEARVDTGAGRTSLDRTLATRIGAGPIVGERSFRSSTDTGETRLTVAVDIAVDGAEHSVEASLQDRSHFSTPVRLGRDILQEYSVEVSQ